ncbi:hypothetical protein [Paenibacillus sp. MBLB4367]|uniref:hypothetical protein n=1 Tax=Paenibacillus sp. MBLB4367 TaxID=3384767 RepID=UPI0039080E62
MSELEIISDERQERVRRSVFRQGKIKIEVEYHGQPSEEAMRRFNQRYHDHKTELNSLQLVAEKRSASA